MSGTPIQQKSSAGLMVGAIGVVYGDIGTSPLYAIKECFTGAHQLAIDPSNILGVLSLVFWSVMIVVSFKYVSLIIRADNRGEGGILALLTLVAQLTKGTNKGGLVVALGIFGAALFYGDSMITPAISVLSAVEGLQVTMPALDVFIIPLTLLILTALFFIQRKGSGSVGGLFGPVMCIWFAILGLLGIVSILREPAVLAALNPLHAVRFFAIDPWLAFLALGSVVLALTGAEALYADIGHFGKRPIRIAWFALVLPALLLNYFGQGALLLREPAAIENPFYYLAPSWAQLPLVILATLATVIASQAVISGAFSMSQQAVQLGYLPRMSVVHTSTQHAGQIYVPFINWTLLVFVLALVLGFQSSTHLAAAYGIAVTGTMLINTLLISAVIFLMWRWNRWIAVSVVGLLLTVDLAFFLATTTKLAHGGWFPLLIGLVVFILLTTWKRGRELLATRLRTGAMPLDILVNSIGASVARVPGTAVFMTNAPGKTPQSLLHNLKHNKVLHERVIMLYVVTEEVPHVSEEQRIESKDLGRQFYWITLHYGFMEIPDIPAALERCAAYGLPFDLMETSFFLNRETLIPSVIPGMALWRERLFAWMSRNATGAMVFFKIPANRVVELGCQVEI